MNYLRLIRLPNIFTALADVWAGCFFVIGAGRSPDWPVLALLLVASGCLYAGGIALNDIFDLEWDRVHRPERPLPSGAIPLRHAVALVLGLFVVALAASGMSGPRSALLCAVLILAIVSYTRLSKKFAPLAAANMGLCRSLNLLLGATAIPAAFTAVPVASTAIPAASTAVPVAWSTAWLPAAVLGMYIYLVTLVSRMEDSAVRPRYLALLLTLVVLVPLTSVVAYREDRVLFGAAVLACLAILLISKGVRAWRERTPPAIGRFIGTSIKGIVLLDAALVIGTGHLAYGLVCLAFIIPPAFLSKKFAMS